MPKDVPPIDLHRIRKIQGSFSWIDHRFITDRWLVSLSREALLLYFFWVTVGDRHGVSFYSNEKTAAWLKLSIPEILQGRTELVAHGLLAYRRGVVQVLALPEVPDD